MEHTATCASKNRVSRFAVLIADFCNKICHTPLRGQLPVHRVRSGMGSSPAGPGRAATRLASIFLHGGPNQLATHYRIPAAYVAREVVETGGLMSYGTDILDMYRQVGVYDLPWGSCCNGGDDITP